MTCPGGCVGGGGQPFCLDHHAVRKRAAALYKVDAAEALRTAHANPSVKRLYEEFLGEPLGKRSHELLHTHYQGREGVA